MATPNTGQDTAATISDATDEQLFVELLRRHGIAPDTSEGERRYILEAGSHPKVGGYNSFCVIAQFNGNGELVEISSYE